MYNYLQKPLFLIFFTKKYVPPPPEYYVVAYNTSWSFVSRRRRYVLCGRRVDCGYMVTTTVTV